MLSGKQAGRYLVLFLLLGGLLQGAHPALRLFTVQDGLARNWINRIRRDSKGDLWFCTVEGLSIFDGYRFINFTTRDGLPSRVANDVLETRGGEYWIATGDGVAIFRPTVRSGESRFDNFRLGTEPLANSVTSLLEDAGGSIWAGTETGLFRVRRTPQAFGAEFVPLATGAKVYALAEDRRHRLWIAALDGVYVRSPDGSLRHFGAADRVPELQSLLVDARGGVWSGSRFGALLGFDAAAEILQVRRATLSDLLRGKSALTPEIALRIEKAFGPDMDHLLRMQLAYDVAKTREHSRDIAVKRYVPV